MKKCPNCGYIITGNFQNNNGTYQYYYCNKCECKWKIDDDKVKIINQGKEILLG